MTYPSVFTIKGEALNATMTASNVKTAVVVPTRGILQAVLGCYTTANQTAVGAIDVWQNGSTLIAGIVPSTGVLGAPLNLFNSTAVSSANGGGFGGLTTTSSATGVPGGFLVNAGDVLVTDASSTVATNFTFVIQSI